jgi:hypothetical protein
MQSARRGLCAVLSLLAIGCAGCGATLVTAGAAVIYYQSKGHQTATVELKAKPDGVYQAAIAAAGKNPAITIVKRDDADRKLEISKDQSTITLEVKALSGDASKLTVSSGKAKEGESGTDYALDAVKRVCEEMKVEYKVVEQ